MYPSSPASLIVVDVDIGECNIATTNVNSTPIVTSISIDVDVGECSSATFNEDSTSLGWKVYVASRDVEPDQLELARRASDPGTCSRIWTRAPTDIGKHREHTARTRGAGLCIQHDRACHRRLDYDAPGDVELGTEVVGAPGKDNVADGWVGECIDQAGDVAHYCRWR